MAGKNKFSSLQKIRGWTCDDVQRALTKNDLKECCQAIAKRNIDGEALLNLTEGKLALWKQDLKHAEIQKLSTFVVNVNFYPEKYSSSADVRGLAGSTPVKTWNQSSPSPSPSKPTPSANKPTAGLRSTGSSNGFGNLNAAAPTKFTKPTPSTNFNKPAPPTNFNKPNPPASFNKPTPPTNFNKPNPPSNFNKPNPPSNFNKPTPPSNFNKPTPPTNFSKPIPSNSYNKPNPPIDFSKPNPPSTANRPVPNASRLFTQQKNLQVDKGPQNEYLPMDRKSPVSPVPSAFAPTNKFTKKPIPEPPKQASHPPPPTHTEIYPLSDEDDDDQPEYLNIDQPETNKQTTSGFIPPDRDDGHHSDAESWGTDFDDAEQDDFDFPPPPAVPSGNQSSLFNSNGIPALPNRPPNREPALPARPVFQPPSAFGYPQPPPSFDNNLLNGLIGQDTPEYAGDEEYSMIDEFDHHPPPPPALAPREYLSKPAPVQIAVPDTMAPSVPHREPVVILPSRNLHSPFAGGRLPDGHSTPKLPPREPYLNRFPRFPEPQVSSQVSEEEDESEYEVIEHREGEDDYLAPTGMQHAVSSESVSSSSALADKLRETLHARKISLSTPSRPETPPLPTMLDYRDKTPTLESKPLPKPPALDRQFSSNQPQRPLPPPPEPGRRPSAGNSSQSLKTKQWYHDVDRRRGEDMLRNGENGSFLLRPSARTENPLTLTLWYDNSIYNIGVRLRPDQRYALGSEKDMERTFGSVDEMVSFYQRELLMLYRGGEKSGSTYLTETPGRRYMSH